MIALSTDYMNEIPSTYEIEKILKKISEASFSHIHWCHDWDGNHIYSIHEMDQIREWLNKYNLKVKAVHATEGGKRPNEDGKYKYKNTYDNRKDYTSENEYNRLAGVELIKNRVDLAERIGAKEIVLHMQLPYVSMEESEEFTKNYWTQVFKSFDELEWYCKSKSIKIAVENLLGTPNIHQVKQFDLLFERYDKDFMGFCYDSGHGILTMDDDPLELLRKYKKRLIAMHLNDNIGIRNKEELTDDVKIASHDLHRIPYEGILDWDELASLVADSPYELPITMEIVCRDGKEDEFLKRAYDNGMKVNNKIKELRED